jgi:hypothetical protein
LRQLTLSNQVSNAFLFLKTRIGAPELDFNRTTRVLGSIVLLLAFFRLGTNARFYNEALISAFFALELASVVIIHFRVQLSLLDALSVLAGTIVLATVDFSVLHLQPAIVSWLSFLGLSSLLVLGLRFCWTVENRKTLSLAFVPALLFVVSEYFADTFLHWTSAVHPRVFDLYLYKFDGSLHVQLPILLGQAFAKWPTLRLISILFYIGLPLPISLIYVGRVLRMGKQALHSFYGFIAAGPIGVLCYSLIPALGPAHLLGKGFPWHPLPINHISRLFLEPVPLAGPPNAMPSLHMAWVLLVWWYSRGLAWWERLVALSFLFFTVIATMGTGEHYFIDLVVAFPFALFIESLFAFDLSIFESGRVIGLSLGCVSTLAWFYALRYCTHVFWTSPLVPWALCTLTIGLSLFFESRLQTTPKSATAKAIAPNPALETVA